MRESDERSWKIALVADLLVNPEASEYRSVGRPTVPAMDLLNKHGYGILQMPSHVLAGRVVGRHISMIMDQVEEYSKRGYKVVFVGIRGLPNKGIWLNMIRNELRSRGIKEPRTVELSLEHKKLDRELATQEFEKFLEK